MPELPEVETVKRGLTPAMEGTRITKLELRRGDLRFPFPTLSRTGFPAAPSSALAAAPNICWSISTTATR
jgi:hypothetical protein